MQHTLKKSVSLSGIGLHSGVKVNLCIHPSNPNQGIVFKYTGEGDFLEDQRFVLAKYDNVIDTRLCTVIGNEHGVRISTIEHLMAAFRGLGIDNALVEIDGIEVPILDGSSTAFVSVFEEAGLQQQDSPRRAIRILEEVVYEEGDKKTTLKPSVIPTYKGAIQYDNPFIGRQSYDFQLINGNFKHDLSDCRTFCLLKDVEMMQANGLAKGGSIENAIVVDENGVINEEGLRCHNEFIRHKLLDAIGDLALAGGLVLGEYEGEKAGHAMNNKLLKKLFDTPSAYEIIDFYVDLHAPDQDVYVTDALSKIVA
jgi:UDP-3-O-[3-hydroxymyristoyl] N-acetylglucosamine deacetylase